MIDGFEKPDLGTYLEMTALARQARYATIVQDQFGDFTVHKERITLGQLSWTFQASKIRWLRKSGVVNLGYGWQTAGEVARDYLDWKYPERLHATGRQAELLKAHKSAPIFCRPTVGEGYSYVDLKSAFWSIMCLAGWDVDYFPDKWLVRGTPPKDFPLPNHKVARNCLASSGLPSPVRIWTGKKVVKQYRYNLHLNLGLWSVIMDTLHIIAEYALRCGAVYVHTDGYIVPDAKVEQMIDFVSGLHLRASVKHSGFLILFGMGDWQIGAKKTKFFGRGHHTMMVHSVRHVPDGLIRRKFDRFAAGLTKD
jgi:hypothetical protein